MDDTSMRVRGGWRWIGVGLVIAAVSSCKKSPEPVALERSEVLHDSFTSPEAAVEALVAAVEAGDEAALKRIFGPGGEPLFRWGDPIAEKQDRARFLDLYRARHRIVDGPDGGKLLDLGDNDWPLPAPLVEREGRWLFDGVEGADELVYRRVGRNELGAIDVARGFVDAQYEYASKAHDGDMAGLFAPYLISDPGRQNGLYWETRKGEPESPAGPFVAAAAGEGYRRAARGEPTPYHGYFYRMLYAQGPDAAGGAKEYFVAGRLVGGFALVAWPAQYGVSGVKTFMVNRDGVVYQKDLGTETAVLADDLELFDPDATWSEVEAPQDE